MALKIYGWVGGGFGEHSIRGAFFFAFFFFKNPHTTLGFLPDPRSASCQRQTQQHGPDGALKKLIGHLILHIEKKKNGKKNELS